MQYARSSGEARVDDPDGGRWDLPVPQGELNGETADAEVRQYVRTELKAYAGRRLFGTNMWIRVQNETDPVVQEARRSWGDAELMAARYPVH